MKKLLLILSALLLITGCKVEESSGSHPVEPEIPVETSEYNGITINYYGTLENVIARDTNWENYYKYEIVMNLVWEIKNLIPITNYELSFDYNSFCYEGNERRIFTTTASYKFNSDKNGMYKTTDTWGNEDNGVWIIDDDKLSSELERDNWIKQHIEEKNNKPFFSMLNIHNIKVEKLD